MHQCYEKSEVEICRILFHFYSGGKGSQNSVDMSGNSLHGKSNSTTVREFLWQHIEHAHSKGFDDNVGRNPPLAVFEVSKVTLE